MEVRNPSPIRRVRLAVLLCVSLAACKTEVFNEQKRVFSDQVLRPIAGQQMEERVSQARGLLAQINLAREQKAAGLAVKTPDTQVLFKTIVALLEPSPDDAQGVERLRSFSDLTIRKPLGERKTEYHNILEWIDRRRLPLMHQLTRQLAETAVPTEKGFLICVSGVQRQYEQGESGRFKRLPDKPG